MDQPFQIGQRLTGYWPEHNERETLAEYASQTARRQLACEVEKILEVTPERYDELTCQFMTDEACGEYGEGGCSSDWKAPEIGPYRSEPWSYWHNATDEQRKEWRDQMYQLITVLLAPDREPILINRHGHTNAQHVGFLTPHPKVLRQIKPKRTVKRSHHQTNDERWREWIEQNT